ncbi:DUF4397 domain-containing protein [Chitinophagaceae bacterium LWZ2-11]
MKNSTSVLRVSLFAIGSIAVGLLFSACSKSTGTVDNSPVSALTTYNLAPNSNAVALTLSGNVLPGAPLGYPNYAGYVSVYSGTRQLQAFDYVSGAALTNATAYVFDTSKYYSSFLVGTPGNYNMVFAQDNYDSLSSTNGKAYVRYINAIPDSSKPLVNIMSGATTVVNTNAAYTSYSGFVAVDPGQVNISVNNGGNIQATRSITTAATAVYTILLIGTPGSTDTTKNVQIRYVANGTLTAAKTVGTNSVRNTITAIKN